MKLSFASCACDKTAGNDDSRGAQTRSYGGLSRVFTQRVFVLPAETRYPAIRGYMLKGLATKKGGAERTRSTPPFAFYVRGDARSINAAFSFLPISK